DSVKKPKSIVDVGYGISGPAIYLAKKYGAKCIGINISPYYVKRGTKISNAQGLGNKVYMQPYLSYLEQMLRFKLEMHFNYPFLMGNLILFGPRSAEYTCLIKQSLLLYLFYLFLWQFVSELVRVAAPGATIILTDPCHRDLANEESLKLDEEEFFLKSKFVLSEWVLRAQYVYMFKSHLLKVLDLF
ncbi:hypothetical protein GIB67_024313, partial [Kingdonia uniflora]